MPKSQIQQSLPPGIELVHAPDFQQWEMDIRVLDANPLYLDQIYRLRFRFDKKYPIGDSYSLRWPLYSSPLANPFSSSLEWD